MVLMRSGLPAEGQMGGDVGTPIGVGVVGRDVVLVATETGDGHREGEDTSMGDGPRLTVGGLLATVVRSGCDTACSFSGWKCIWRCWTGSGIRCSGG
jgi:hypothetical protein